MNKLKTNSINPAKLPLSKWTATQPANKEKHFLVSKVIKDEQDFIVGCILEAVLTHKEYQIDWRELKNTDLWSIGWL